MPEAALTPEDAALLASRIACGDHWLAISAAMGCRPIPSLKRHAARLRLAHDAPGAWPQIIDPDEDDDGVARPMGDPLLDALERCHQVAEVRTVPLREGLPRRVVGEAVHSSHGSPAAMVVER